MGPATQRKLLMLHSCSLSQKVLGQHILHLLQPKRLAEHIVQPSLDVFVAILVECIRRSVEQSLLSREA